MPTLRRVLLGVVMIALAVYAGLLALLYFAQERLIFIPQPESVGPLVPPPGWRVTTQGFTGHDGLPLSGLLVEPPSKPRALVVYYGGNAQEISYLTAFADRYGEVALLLVNYRGYGGNPGVPSEAGLIADALGVLTQAQAKTGFADQAVFLHGRSLGTGVATGVAARRKVGGVVLTTPFDSVTAVATASYPIFPVAWLLRHPFDSAARAPLIASPVLILVAGADQVIPPVHAHTLASQWRGPKQVVEYAGRSHEDVAGAPGYWDTIAAFILATTATYQR